MSSESYIGPMRSLDLRAVQETLDWHDAPPEVGEVVQTSTEHELVITQLRALLVHCRALRAALEPFVAMGRIEGKFLTARPDGNTAVIVVNLGDLRRAAAVLRGAQDQEG